MQDIEFLLYQLVNLYEEGIKKSMSTRRGEYFSLDDLREGNITGRVVLEP